jgi:hypothetical protein
VLKDIRPSYLQLIPLTTERATSLAPASYTSLVVSLPRNTLSIPRAWVNDNEMKQLGRELCF